MNQFTGNSRAPFLAIGPGPSELVRPPSLCVENRGFVNALKQINGCILAYLVKAIKAVSFGYFGK